MTTRILRTCLGPLCAAVLIFAPSALAGPNMVANPGFETGSLAPYWSWDGSYGAYTGTTPLASHSGVWSAQIGITDRPTNIESAISTWVAVPPGHPTLSFWARTQCTSNLDWFEVQVRDMFGYLRSIPVDACLTTWGAWNRFSADLSLLAAQPAQLRFVVHSTGRGWGATYALVDDVSVS